ARLAAGIGALGERGRPRTPLWQRLHLDLLALVISGLVYWLTARTGFSAVVNPDSNPTLSLSVYMFLAPALLWIGATLLLVRLRRRARGGRAGNDRRRPHVRLRRARPAGHVRDRPHDVRPRDDAARLVLPRRQRHHDARPAAVPARRGAGLEGDDHRLLALPR